MTGTSPPDCAARRARAGNGEWWPVAAVTTALGIVGLVLAATRPWGDTGTDGGRLRTDTPVPEVALLAVALLCATVVVASTATGRPATRVVSRSRESLIIVAFGAATAALIMTIDLTSRQIQPRDGGWFALMAAVAALVAATAAALNAAFAPPGFARWVVAGVGLLVVVALVTATAVVAPDWPTHRLTARYQEAFSEGALPAGPTEAAWHYGTPEGTDVVGVIGGQIITIAPAAGRAAEAGGHSCGVTVTALDPATADVDWTVRRPLRCDGPAIETVDGNSQVVRLRFGDDQPTSVRDIYYATGSGHELFPTVAADRVTQWTEGFGLVTRPGAATVQGIAPTTGEIAWTRDAPRDCAVGRQQAHPYATPVDDQQPPGALAVIQAGNTIVLGYTCPVADGPTGRHAWLIDTVAGAAADHDITLPDGTDGSSASDAPTSFVAGLDTVTAVVPTGSSDEAFVVGIDLASGAQHFRRGPLVVRSIDRTPSGQVVVGTRTAQSAGTEVIDAADGTTDESYADPPHTGARLQLARGQLLLVDTDTGWTAVLRDPLTGTAKNTIDLPGCMPTADDTTITSLVAAPGSIVVRCQGRDGHTSAIIGLT